MRALRTFAALASVAALGGCANENATPHTYANSDEQLAVGNMAKMGCSCLFVMNMDEAYCKAWLKVTPAVARFSYDPKAKTVEASAFIVWSAKAHFVDDKRGCVLE
jgi:hypothetical protein